MTLTMDQLRALAKLARCAKMVKAARDEFDAAEEECWRMGITDRQVAAVGRDSFSSVRRRRLRRHAIRAEFEGVTDAAQSAY